MKLSEFLHLFSRYFQDKILPDSTGKKSGGYLCKELLLKCVLEDESEEDPLPQSPEYLTRVFNGICSLPSSSASSIKRRLDSDSIADFIGDPPDDVKEAISRDFLNSGETVSSYDLPNGIRNVLDKILTTIIDLPDQLRLDKVTIHQGVVHWKNKSITLPPALDVPGLLGDDENKYIDALLQVYAQDSKKPVLTIDEISKLDPIYSEHLTLQRQNYYCAESVFHQVRDTFVDGEIEFSILKEETLAGVEDIVGGKCKNGYDRVEKTLTHATLLTLTKSRLTTSDKDLIGPREKKGIIHILVNDGKIVWIKDYDTDI